MRKGLLRLVVKCQFIAVLPRFKAMLFLIDWYRHYGCFCPISPFGVLLKAFAIFEASPGGGVSRLLLNAVRKTL